MFDVVKKRWCRLRRPIGRRASVSPGPVPVVRCKRPTPHALSVLSGLPLNIARNRPVPIGGIRTFIRDHPGWSRRCLSSRRPPQGIRRRAGKEWWWRWGARCRRPFRTGSIRAPTPLGKKQKFAKMHYFRELFVKPDLKTAGAHYREQHRHCTVISVFEHSDPRAQAPQQPDPARFLPFAMLPSILWNGVTTKRKEKA